MIHLGLKTQLVQNEAHLVNGVLISTTQAGNLGVFLETRFPLLVTLSGSPHLHLLPEFLPYLGSCPHAVPPPMQSPPVQPPLRLCILLLHRLGRHTRN